MSESARSRLAGVEQRLLAAAILLLLVVAAPNQWWPGVGLAAAFLLGWALYAPDRRRRTLARLALLTPLLAVLALSLAWSADRPRDPFAAAVVAKVFLSVLIVEAALGSVSPAALIGALGRAGAPQTLAAAAALALRYQSVLEDESRRMRRAKAARSAQGGWLADWRLLPRLIGVLWIRSYERSERIHHAMLARGGAGRMRFLHPASLDG